MSQVNSCHIPPFVRFSCSCSPLIYRPPYPPHLVTHAANPTHPVPRYALSLPPRLRLPTPFIGSSLRSSSLHSPFRLFGPVAGTETGDDDDERSRSGRRPVRSPLTHFFPHPPRGPVTHSRPSSLHSGPSFVTGPTSVSMSLPARPPYVSSVRRFTRFTSLPHSSSLLHPLPFPLVSLPPGGRGGAGETWGMGWGWVTEVSEVR